MGEGSGRHLGGIWRQLGGIWEESELHLEASGRHLKETSGGSMGPGGIQEPERQLGGKVCQNHYVLQCPKLGGRLFRLHFGASTFMLIGICSNLCCPLGARP